MRSFIKIIRIVFTLATISAASIIISCNDRQGHYLKNDSSADKVSESRTKELVKKYNDGKEIFEQHCSTCHIAPHKKATDQILFYNLFARQTSDYVFNYISDSKKLKLSGDKYAIALDKEYNSDFEHSFKDTLSNLNLDNLLNYLKVATH